MGQLTANALAGRILGPGSFGGFSAVMAAAALVSQLGLLGAQNLALRDASLMREKPDQDLLREHLGHVRTVTRTVLPVVGLATGLVVGVTVPASLWAGVVLCCAVTVLVWVGGVQKLYANYLRGFGEVRLSTLLEGRSGGALFMACQALALLALLAVAGKASLTTSIIVVAMSGVPGAMLGAFRVRPRFGGLTPEPGGRARGLRALAARSGRFASVQASTFLDTNADIFIALAVLSASDSSNFAAAQRMAMMIIIPRALLQLVSSPAIVRHRHDRQELERLVRGLATVGTAMALGIAVPLAVGGGQFATLLFGDGFGRAGEVLVILSAGYVLRVVVGFPSICLSMTGHEGLVARWFWGGIAIRVVVGGLTGWVWGLNALTVTSVLVTVVVMAGQAVSVRRLLDIKTMPTFRPHLRQLIRTAG